MSQLPITTLDTTLIAPYCRRHRIREFAIFGSTARGELTPESDIDVQVDFADALNA